MATKKKQKLFSLKDLRQDWVKPSKPRTQVQGRRLPKRKQLNFFALVRWRSAIAGAKSYYIIGSYNGLGLCLISPPDGKLVGKWYGTVVLSSERDRALLIPHDTLIKTPYFGNRKAAINNLKAQFNALVSAVTGY